MGYGNDRIQGIHQADIATCAIDALKNKKASHKTFLMGGPETLTLKQVAEIYSRILGYKVRTIPIPLAVQKIVGTVADAVTSYQYNVQGFMEAFGGESICDNGPLLDAFNIELSYFEDYLKEYLS
jgi:nucleoside-diphosphate-sugar epimerase